MSEPLSASAAILSIVERAHAAGARCVHLERDGELARFRFRHGGVLAPWSGAPAIDYAQLVARLKGAVGLGTRPITEFEQRALQVNIGDAVVEVELMIQPGLEEEQVILGLPDGAPQGSASLSDLGVEPAELALWRQALDRRRGLILVGGSTRGLAQRVATAAVSEIDARLRCITALMAVPGPLPEGVHGVPVDSHDGWHPAEALQAQFAMDVDAILVGFTPDDALAAAMVEGALIHDKLIIATMPSKDAVGLIRGMVALGVEAWPLAEAVILVHGSARVRTLCTGCRKKVGQSKSALAPYGLERAEVNRAILYRPKGCARCGGSGYAGHRVLGETAQITAATADAIVDRGGRQALAATLVVGGLNPLRRRGVELACQGVTSLAEAVAETPQC